MNPNLTHLRRDIADVDRELLALLGRRFALAAEVGRYKAERGHPIIVREVEDEVLSRARDAAGACGTTPEVMEGIYRAIVRGAVDRQLRLRVERNAEAATRVLILGAAGGMGSWLRRFLESVGHRVEGVDVAWAGTESAAGGWAALDEVPELRTVGGIFVSVPLETTGNLLQSLAAQQLTMPVVEIASIKSHLQDPILNLRRAGTPTLSLHPMFGPSKPLCEPMTIVHAVWEDEEIERRRIEELMDHPYVELVSLPVEHHDRLMGWLLGLAHLTGLLFAGALCRSKLDPEELAKAASTTFARQVATAESILGEDPALYFAIQRLNPYRGAIYAALTSALGELTGAVEQDDRAAFAAAMSRAAEALPK